MFASRLSPQAHGHIKESSTITVTFGAHPCIRASTFHHSWLCYKAMYRFSFFSLFFWHFEDHRLMSSQQHPHLFSRSVFWELNFHSTMYDFFLFFCLECRCAVGTFTWHSEHLIHIRDFWPYLPFLGMRTPLLSPPLLHPARLSPTYRGCPFITGMENERGLFSRVIGI